MNRHTAARAVMAAAVSALLATSGAVAAQATAVPPPTSTVPSAAQPDGDMTDRVIVGYRMRAPGGASGALAETQRRSRVERAAAGLGAPVEYVRDTSQGAQVWTFGEMLPVEDVAAVARGIAAADSTVEYAEPDRIMRPLADASNDPRWSDQWSLRTSDVGVHVLGAWDVTRGAGVDVAVIDTGYRPHADLAANIVGGYDMISDAAVSNDGDRRDADATDPGDYTVPNECGRGWPGYSSSWHGTHVAGIVAAVTGNGVGVAGIAPQARVVPVRVLGTCGGYTSDIADAMVWASGGSVAGVPANANPARALNLSLGGSGACGTTTQNAINTARNNGAVVVVAAGNEAVNVANSSPANCSGVVAVAAFGPTGARAYYSNYGSLVDLAAPGGDQSARDSDGILSTLNAGTTVPAADSYEYYQGTSMAAPHVAAVAALMVSANPSLTPSEVESLLKSSARPFVASCSGCGAGMLDADAAVHAAIGETPPTPPTPPAGFVEVEPNNRRSAANAVPSPGSGTGAMGSTSDTDYFSVALPAGATLTATVAAVAATADYDLYLYNSRGTLVARSENGAGVADTASVRNGGASTATYYVRVVYYSGGTGATAGAYGLQLDW